MRQHAISAPWHSDWQALVRVRRPGGLGLSRCPASDLPARPNRPARRRPIPPRAMRCGGRWRAAFDAVLAAAGAAAGAGAEAEAATTAIAGAMGVTRAPTNGVSRAESRFPKLARFRGNCQAWSAGPRPVSMASMGCSRRSCSPGSGALASQSCASSALMLALIDACSAAARGQPDQSTEPRNCVASAPRA